MKKKILAALMCVVLSLHCIACGTTYQKATGEVYAATTYGGGYFNTIVEWTYLSTVYRIVYAVDTNVKYLIASSGYKFGITPLYNADGTLQTYEAK